MKFIVVRVPGSDEALLIDRERMTVCRAPEGQIPADSPALEGIPVPSAETVSARMYYHQVQPAPQLA